ncbi:MAG: hypothetical protein K0U59_02895 [Gammaproteobacteria bacterium]|nr:hypothetical protein [Gammaproteobacteria bacterium]
MKTDGVLKPYQVRVAFKWRGHWREPGERLTLLDCEALALNSADKIVPVINRKRKRRAKNAQD